MQSKVADVDRQAREMGNALMSARCECAGVSDPCASCADCRVAEDSPERELCDKEGEGGRAGEGGGHMLRCSPPRGRGLAERECCRQGGRGREGDGGHGWIRGVIMIKMY